MKESMTRGKTLPITRLLRNWCIKISGPMSKHVDDIRQVAFINGAALAVSVSDFEQYIRILGLVMACVYTGIKIWQALTHNE
jgi:hypothetical protein